MSNYTLNKRSIKYAENNNEEIVPKKKSKMADRDNEFNKLAIYTNVSQKIRGYVFFNLFKNFLKTCIFFKLIFFLNLNFFKNLYHLLYFEFYFFQNCFNGASYSGFTDISILCSDILLRRNGCRLPKDTCILFRRKRRNMV